MLSACTSVQSASTGNSMSSEVATISRAGHEYPSFADIPAVPTDIRAAKAWGQAARASEDARLKLEQATADNTWTLTGTDSFVAKALSEAGPAQNIAASTTAATESYARELRRRATPPSPPKR